MEGFLGGVDIEWECGVSQVVNQVNVKIRLRVGMIVLFCPASNSMTSR